jgi:hypothetical protein
VKEIMKKINVFLKKLIGEQQLIKKVLDEIYKEDVNARII